MEGIYNLYIQKHSSNSLWSCTDLHAQRKMKTASDDATALIFCENRKAYIPNINIKG
jgi:hypothetical protein